MDSGKAWRSAAPVKRNWDRAGGRMLGRESENSYPNRRMRRLRKTQRGAGPKIFKAVGPLLRL